MMREIPINKLKIDDSDRILIVAPHPDDEIIGCGGVIVKHGHLCDVILLTDGCKGHTQWSESRTRRVRESEFRHVMEQAKVSNYYILGHMDRELNKQWDVYLMMDLEKYTHIFIPNCEERHPDHYSAFRQMFIDQMIHHRRIQYYQYEVWTPLARPTHIFDISESIDEKIQLLALYKSQIDELNYIDAVKGLNKYRGSLNQMNYAECYKLGLWK